MIRQDLFEDLDQLDLELVFEVESASMFYLTFDENAVSRLSLRRITPIVFN